MGCVAMSDPPPDDDATEPNLPTSIEEEQAQEQEEEQEQEREQEQEQEEEDPIEAADVARGAPRSVELLRLLEGAHEVARAWIDGELQGLGLTREDVIFLAKLQTRHEDGFAPPITDFAGVVERAKQRVSQVARRLASARLIEMQAHPRDRRIKSLMLTDEGRRRLARAQRIIDSIARELFAGLDAANKKDFRWMLVSVHAS
jgi:DNA-binding MarR family transcriptional regulator